MCTWNIMADSYGFKNIEIMDLVYCNQPVKRFLNSEESMGVAACKGMGKTFLLKVKRMQLFEKLDSSALLLPKDQLVDTPGPITLNKMHVSFLSSYSNWVSLWISCFAIYILSMDEIKVSYKTQELEEFNDIVKQLINCENNGIFHVLSRILNTNSKANLRLVVQSAGLLFALLQQINRPIYFFIDKLEEPFNRGFYRIPGGTMAAEGRYNSSIWAYSQLSFAEAVYRLYSGRHHIKIFYGIRQEALFGGETITVEFSKIYGQMISKLDYSFDDLYKMFCQYIRLENPKNLYDYSYVDTNPIRALCGISTIKHRTGSVEQMWAYICRHSLQRPRDLMEMGMILYQRIVCSPILNSLTEKDLVRYCRLWVNEISTRQCMEYLTSLEPFMAFNENIAFAQKIISLLKNLPTNVLTAQSVLEYCHQTNCNCGEINCTKCENIHYFSSLYNIGLLGFVYKSDSENGYKNRIKQIGDSVYDISAQTLPKAELYYVHPGIGNIIKTEREKSMKQYIPSLFVINSSEIFAKKDEITLLQDFCHGTLGNQKENSVFLTSTGHDLSNERKRIKTLLENRGYKVYAYEFKDFPQMPPDSEHYKGKTHDHCIDILLTCKHVIYVFDGRFGGKYCGHKYQKYIDEQKSVIDIQPSVSFVEYLVAKKFNKNTKVYARSEIETARGEWIANQKQENYHSKVVDNNDVFRQLGYFNELGNSTWIDKYPDTITLEEYISAHFPILLEN